MKKEDFDIFVNYKTYPSAKTIFGTSLLPISEIKDDCIFIFDTNALLVPYSTGSQSLTEIDKVFQNLKKQNRILVPAQVAREFANNRPEKLKEIFQQLNRKQNSIQSVGIGKYPLLEEIADYKKAIELEKEINEKLIQYRKSIGVLVDQVKFWIWNDPVSLIYRNVFTEDTILDFEIDREKIKQELDYRYLHKIPPGFKDEGKSDDGIGDFLIWLAIIEVAKTKKNVIFVSGDEKTDWFHKSEKQALYPRFELINEFATNSGGKSFHIVRLSELLNLLGADEKVVKEVEIEEKVNLTNYDEFRLFASQAERAIFNWLLLRDDLGVRPNQIGYPDFEVSYDDGTKSGVEVIPINENRNSMIIGSRIKEKMFRAYYEIKEKRFDRIQFVFVAITSNYNFVQLNNSLEKSTNGFDKGSIEFIFGHLNEQNEFIRTN